MCIYAGEVVDLELEDHRQLKELLQPTVKSVHSCVKCTYVHTYTQMYKILLSQ